MSNLLCEQPRWLTNALIQVGRLAENTAHQKRQNQMARTILRGCEIDGIHPPEIWRDDRNRLCMRWENGFCSALFVISRPASYSVRLSNSEFLGYRHVIVSCKDYQDKARYVAEWLFPQCSPCSEAEIDAWLKVTR